MGFFAKSKGAGLLDDRRNDVKGFKLILKNRSFLDYVIAYLKFHNRIPPFIY